MAKVPKKPRKSAAVKARPKVVAKPKRKVPSKAKVKSARAPKMKAKVATRPTATKKMTATATKKRTPTRTATPTPTPTPTKKMTPTATRTATATGTGTGTGTGTPTHGLRGKRLRAENLGELPERYEDDALVALPVDPSTLFVWWDPAPGSVARAANGLIGPQARLAIVEGQKVVREVELALESRSFYVKGLPPGHRYQAELLWLDVRGNRRQIARSSKPVGLPPRGPSRTIHDRFARFRFDGKLGARVDPASLPPGPDRSSTDGSTGFGSSEQSPGDPGPASRQGPG